MQIYKQLSNLALMHRKADYGISPFIVQRWSPRAMTGEEIDDNDLMALFEAARWAPSSYNNQPWRFIYAKRNTRHWEKMFNLLVEFNQGWAKNASVLVTVISKKTFDSNKPSITHGFDAGAAWQNLALEAANRGIVAHGIEGLDYEKAKKVLKVPDDYDVECMVAIGIMAEKEILPKELQERELPSQRKELKEIVMEGEFQGNRIK